MSNSKAAAAILSKFLGLSLSKQYTRLENF